MPQINLSDLSGPELRQRLDSSRARGDATLAYEILREMAARRTAEAGRRRAKGNGRRRAGEPRVVDVDLGDPLDRGDDLPPMPHWRAPDLAAAEAEAAAAETVTAAEPPEAPPRFRTLEAPLALVEPGPEPAPRSPEPELESEPEPGPEGLRLTMASEAPARPPRRPRAGGGHGMRIAAGFAVGITSGVALGWFAADFARETPPSPAPLQVVAQVAPPPPAPPVVALATGPAAPAPETEVAEAPAAADAAIPAAAAELELPAASSPPVETAAASDPVAAGGCAAEPTPADREICADPELQRLQRDLRRAYAEALDAHEDRALLRQRQLAWREARSDIADPGRLARLYEQRIRRLDAAAAEARSLR